MPYAVPRTIAITGANSGIGLRAAEQLASAGHRVAALCRNPERGRVTLDTINASARHPATLVVADLSDPESIDTAADHISREFGHLDVLINNAAVFDQSIRRAVYTPSGHELFWATNHLGPFRLTARLSPLLAAAAQPRLINIASNGLISMSRIKLQGRAAVHGIYLDEQLRPVKAPVFAYGETARDRLWSESQNATGNLPWA